MVWPTGFVKSHKKETVEYRSDELLHNGKVPYLPAKLQGGVIIDLGTSEIRTQVSQLLQIDELVPDYDLCHYLDETVSRLKIHREKGLSPRTPAVNLFDSPLYMEMSQI